MMKLNPAHTIGRLRLCGLLEGGSFLLLLFVAMPLKYLLNYPAAVKVVGMTHGILFIIFVLLIGLAWLDKKLTAKHAGLALLASVIPFGPFFMDRRLAADEVAEAISDGESDFSGNDSSGDSSSGDGSSADPS